MRDAEPFQLRLDGLVVELEDQFAESARLDAAIVYNLDELGYGG